MAYLFEKLKDIFTLSRSDSNQDHINLHPRRILEAAEMGHIQDVKNLLQRGIDVNYSISHVNMTEDFSQKALV